MVNKKNVRIAIEPIGYIFGVLLFSMIAVFIFSELHIEHLGDIFFFVPRLLFVVLGILLIIPFSFTFIYGMFDLNKNLASPAKHLIVNGMFRYVRHPIYAGLSFTIMGFGLLYESTGFFVGGILWLILFYTRARNEERHLIEIFKETYIHYRSTTQMFLPDFFRLIEDLFK